MSRTIEVPDIAQWEETDSKLAKYTIQKLNCEMREVIELVNYLGKEKLKLQERIDKAIEYIEARHIKAQVELTDREKELLNILRGEDNESN